MTTACPCFGRNENCRLCQGSGLVTSEVEAKVARSQLAVQTPHYSGQSDAQKAIERQEEHARIRREAAALEAKTPAAIMATKLRAEEAAKELEQAREAEQAKGRREAAALEESGRRKRMQVAAALEAEQAKGRREAAALEAKTPAGIMAAKRRAVREAEQTAKEAEQAAKSIAYWRKRWGEN